MADFISPWLKMLGGGNNDEINPAVMSQMSQQAAPIESGGMSKPAPMPRASAQAPMIVPPPPAKESPYSVQPTVQPTGTLPQEIKPTQPSLMDMYSRIEALRPIDNSKMLNEMALGDKSYNEGVHQTRDEVSRLKEALANYTKADRGLDFSPLAALSDQWYGSNLAGAAKQMAPETEAQKLQNIAAMQGKIVSAQGELPKMQMDALKNKLAQMGYMDERQNKLEMAKIAAEAKLAVGAQTGANQTNRIDNQQARIAAQAISKIDTHPSMVQMTNQMNQIDLDKHTLDQYKGDPKGVPITVLNELFQGVGSAIGGGKGAGLGQTERNDVRNASTSWANFKQKLEPGVETINDKGILDLAEKTLNRLGESYENNSYLTAKKIGVGTASAYSKQPLALKAVNEKIESYRPGNRAKVQASFAEPSQEDIAAEIARRGLNK